MAKKIYYVAALPFGYMGQQLDRQQVTELHPEAPKNEQLIRLGYFVPFDGNISECVECPGCGAKFTGHNAKISHARLRHEYHDEQDEDRLIDAEDKIISQLNPLRVAQPETV